MTEDVYDSDYLEAMMDNDEVSPTEAGLMQWYDADEEKSFQSEDTLAQAWLNEEENNQIA